MTTIQAGVEEASVANMIELVRTNSERFIDITFLDSCGNPISIEEGEVGGEPTGKLNLSITDLGDNEIYSESYWPTNDASARRIKNPSTGRYYINFGTESGETDTPGTYLANWHIRQDTSTENIYSTQIIEIISPRTLSLLPKLRFMADKTVKPVLPSSMCFLGFTDGQLIMSLQLGLQMMNEYQPYPCWNSLDYYDIVKHGHVLIKAGLYQLLTAQGIFAIDTDVPSFNDQGHSFVLVHFAGLEQVANRIKNELDRLVPDVKRHYVSSGSLGMEIRMNAASYQTFQSMPYGSVYRNFFSRT